jgi:hypothetical protein
MKKFGMRLLAMVITRRMVKGWVALKVKKEMKIMRHKNLQKVIREIRIWNDLLIYNFSPI